MMEMPGGAFFFVERCPASRLPAAFERSLYSELMMDSMVSWSSIAGVLTNSVYLSKGFASPSMTFLWRMGWAWHSAWWPPSMTMSGIFSPALRRCFTSWMAAGPLFERGVVFLWALWVYSMFTPFTSIWNERSVTTFTLGLRSSSLPK